MSRNFEIHAEPEHNLLCLRIFGPMSPDDIDALFAERERLTSGFDCPPGHHRALVDARDAPVQSEETMERLEAHSAAIAMDARRAAIVIAPDASPGRLQLRDLGARYNLYLFDRMEDAERWIRL